MGLSAALQPCMINGPFPISMVLFVMRNIQGAFAVLVMAALLSACGQPLPPERMNYAGVWGSNEVNLQITLEGRIEYKSIKGGGKKSLSAPIQEFTDDRFRAGIGPLSTTFIIDEPPTLQDNRWTMVIDGERLTRIRP